MSELKDFQRTFIELALQSHALEFGKFTLKSGRSSPYFFNAAKMLNGCDLFKLANCYVDAIEDSSMEFDCLYGPAYKGIFLGSIVATVFSQRGNPALFLLIEKKSKIMVRVAILLAPIQLEM
jgi:orotate phosphoribosyltransferase